MSPLVVTIVGHLIKVGGTNPLLTMQKHGETHNDPVARVIFAARRALLGSSIGRVPRFDCQVDAPNLWTVARAPPLMYFFPLMAATTVVCASVGRGIGSADDDTGDYANAGNVLLHVDWRARVHDRLDVYQ